MDGQDYGADISVFEDIHICNERLIEELEKYPYKIVVLGLDCEWVSEERRQNGPACPVALLQLAFPDGKGFLIRLCQMAEGLPDKLREILEDRNVLKTGVGIGEDAKRLSSCYGLVMQGCVDLRHVASRCRAYVQHSVCEGGARHGMSLCTLSEQIIGITLDKDWRIRCSDWEAPNLSERQVQYAANDAIVALRIIFMLAASKLKDKEDRFEAGVDKRKELGISGGETVCPKETFILNERNVQKGESFVQGDHASQTNVSGSKIGDSNSEESILSGLLSKLGKFSPGSIFGPQTEAKMNTSKMCTQFPSFRYLKVSEDLLNSDDMWSCLVPLCQGIVDVPFKTKQKSNKSDENDKIRQQPALHTRNKLSGLQPRRAPLYQNCVIEAPDGEMLSTCDRRKADWYLCRDLADVVKADPYTIRLRFEPSGRPLDPENNYYLTFKDNMCVVCGRDDNYMRKNIIPHDYRRHFPTCMKDHHSHDVLLLCPACHMISTHHDDMLRKKLAKKYNAPLGNQASSQVARLVQDPQLKNVKSAAKALVYAGDKIPAKRREELAWIVKEYFEDDNLTEEMLRKASEMETRRGNCDFISHGREVVRKVKETGELLIFERMWREHFLETMQPKYLPALWTVDHEQEKVKRLLQKELINEARDEDSVDEK